MARYTPADKSLYKYAQDKYAPYILGDVWKYSSDRVYLGRGMGIYIQSRVYNRRGLEIFSSFRLLYLIRTLRLEFTRDTLRLEFTGREMWKYTQA